MSKIELPWELIEGSDEPAPGMVPVERSELGADLGAHLARFVDQSEPPGAPPRCHDCAFRRGTLANQSLGTMANALKCAMEGIPFYCHHGEIDGSPTLLCRGWIALQPEEVLIPLAAQIAAAKLAAPHHLTPPVTASGGNAETTEERAPQPPAEQPQRRLPLDDDS